jgi:hypothetical protein
VIRNQRGRGMAEQYRAQPVKAYRFKNEPGWDPAELGPMETAPQGAARRMHEEREERLARFSAHRAEGVPVQDAAALVGISPATAREYEKTRLGRLEAGTGGAP